VWGAAPLIRGSQALVNGPPRPYPPHTVRTLLSAAALLLGLSLASLPVQAQDEAPPPTRLEPVVVTVTRIEQQSSEAPGSVTVVTDEDIRHSASQTVDDLLRQVPGFSLFRRSSSLVTHPTAQGVSLRGIGPSGTSRALVLLDGVPINDPFGGWVYWSRVPLQSIQQIEVVRGGGSSVWGNYALGGVINVITRRPTEQAAFLDASYGTHDTHNVDLLLTEARGPLRLSIEGNDFSTGGYDVVKASRRGSVDIEADSRHSMFTGRADLVQSSELSLFLTGSYFDESRGNGTPLQFNRTESEWAALGGSMRAGESDWSFTLSSQVQNFRSTFSNQAANRNSETLALDQIAPSASVAAYLQWSRRFGNHLLSAGIDGRWTEGETDERVFTAGVYTRRREAGGQQALTGAFAQDVITLGRLAEIVAGLRGDSWTSYEGFRRDIPPAAGVPARQSFSDVNHLAASPRLAALVHATPSTDLLSSVYQGFRVPTVNELYRVFRVRNDVTVANEHLRPERLTGGELGVHQRWAPVEVRVTGFWNEVTDLVANVTVPKPLPDCPAGTTCRQRQNVDLARIRGIEAEVSAQLSRDWRIIAGYLLSDTRVVESSRQRTLEGNRLAQVPEHSASLTVRYLNPAWADVSVTGRYVGRQFEDDANTLPMGSYFVVDVTLSRRFAKWGEAYLGVENLFDQVYTTGRTSEGVISIGAPLLARAGVRLKF
jgi:iron complex outermembrane receptor protein